MCLCVCARACVPPVPRTATCTYDAQLCRSTCPLTACRCAVASSAWLCAMAPVHRGLGDTSEPSSSSCYAPSHVSHASRTCHVCVFGGERCHTARGVDKTHLETKLVCSVQTLQLADQLEQKLSTDNRLASSCAQVNIVIGQSCGAPPRPPPPLYCLFVNNMPAMITIRRVILITCLVTHGVYKQQTVCSI